MSTITLREYHRLINTLIEKKSTMRQFSLHKHPHKLSERYHNLSANWVRHCWKKSASRMPPMSSL